MEAEAPLGQTSLCGFVGDQFDGETCMPNSHPDAIKPIWDQADVDWIQSSTFRLFVCLCSRLGLLLLTFFNLQ
jgi:hypothetical protein